MPAPVAVVYSGTSGASSAGGLGGQLSAAILTVYSKQLIFAFQPFTFFDQFTIKKTELGLLPGNTIQFLKYANLTAGGALAEDTAVSVQPLSASSISLSVKEWGNAVSVTEFLLHSSFDDIMSSTAKLLGMDYAKVIDLALRDQMETDVTNNIFGGSATTSANLNAATSQFSTLDVKDGVETLKTLNVPGIPEAGGSYVCIMHPHQARALRDDNAWINASNYAGAVQIFNGEIGKYEDVRFVETTQCKSILGNGSSVIGRSGAGVFIPNGVTEYHAYLMGYNLLAHAVALPVEMRDGGVIDFSRQHNLAWYSIEGYKCIQPESGVVIAST